MRVLDNYRQETLIAPKTFIIQHSNYEIFRYDQTSMKTIALRDLSRQRPLETFSSPLVIQISINVIKIYMNQMNRITTPYKRRLTRHHQMLDSSKYLSTPKAIKISRGPHNTFQEIKTIKECN